MLELADNDDAELNSEQEREIQERDKMLSQMKKHGHDNEESDDDRFIDALGGLSTYKQMAEYKARSIQDYSMAEKIRKGYFGEDELVAFLEKDSLVDLMQG